MANTAVVRTTLGDKTGVEARVRDVHVRRGVAEALRGVDLDVEAGRLTVLTGPNGAGKSTLLEVLAGVLAPTSGSVSRSGRAAAFVPQRAAVPDGLPVSVREVVTMGAWGGSGLWRRVGASGRARVRGAIEVVGMIGLTNRSFATLSGGERQRALLAQGLARDAGLLLLDEPTTGLDSASVAHVCEAITHEVRRGVSVVCVSHDPVVIELAERVVRLESGRVVTHPAGGVAPTG